MATEREAAAVRALKRSSLVLDALPHAVVVADLDGTILAWNHVAQKNYSLTADQAVGRSILAFFSGRDTDEVRRIVDLVRAGETWTGAVPVTCRAASRTGRTRGSHRYATNREASSASSERRTRLSPSCRVLQRKASDLGEHLVLALAAGELGTWRWDMATGKTEWDATLERIFGLEPGSFDGHVRVVDLADSSGRRDRHRGHPRPGRRREVGLRGRAPCRLAGRKRPLDPRPRHDHAGCRRKRHGLDRVRLRHHGPQALRDRRGAPRSRRPRRPRIANGSNGSVSSSSAELNRVASNARDYRSLMRAVTTAAVPQLGDWCTLALPPRAGRDARDRGRPLRSRRRSSGRSRCGRGTRSIRMLRAACPPSSAPAGSSSSARWTRSSSTPRSKRPGYPTSETSCSISCRSCS